MEVKTIIQEIQQLPLTEKFFVIEQTLKAIKNMELKQQTEIGIDGYLTEYTNDKELTDVSYSVSESSLANDWLSEEDSRWDNLL
jgi:hypothetical protein